MNTRIDTRFTKRLISVIALLITVLVMMSIGQGQHQASAQTTGPCDIYASGGTSCVAAHSTVRALYGSYNGRLYQVTRSNDGQTTDINTLSAGGFANAAAQDSFCAGTYCFITIIYDQSGRGNHLTPAPPGGVGWQDAPANAAALPLTVGGHNVYGVHISPGVGYRNNSTSGIAIGDQPEGMYAVFSGTYYNGQCCFDYGNAETNNLDNGNGTMEALYFGNNTYWGHGSGSGPWVMADLENGLFAGGTLVYNGNLSISSTYVTAILKGEPNHFAIRAGNSQSGSLTTMYDGARPTISGYNPMKKEGAIILGIGGDNSNSAAGNFYEGAMTYGYPSNATENSVQANIVAAGYTGNGGGSYVAPSCGGTDSGGTYTTIVNRNSGKVLDIQATPYANNCDGANVGQYTSNGGAWQQWRLASSVSGYYTIISQNSGKCLDVQQPNTDNGANVGIWTCNGSAWQDWQLVDQGSGYYEIVSRNSGKCLDVWGWSTSNGANIAQYTCTGGTNQQFQLPGFSGGGGGTFPVAGTQYRLINQNSGKVVDVSNCSTANGGNIQQWSDLGNNCQKFTFVATGNYYEIVNVNSGKCLDDWAWSTSDGGNIAQYTCTGGNNQLWNVQDSGSGYYTLVNVHSGKVLDVDSCGTADGTNIQQWSSLNNSCQHFQITP